MEIIRAIFLGIVQGATEFIPVSSSAHLVLVPWALRWPAPSLFFDTMLHWGTLLAIITYFWRDWLRVLRGFWASLTTRGPWRSVPGGRLQTVDSRLAWALIIGTIPAALIGYLFDDFVEGLFHAPLAVGAFLLVTAVILTISERLGRRTRELDQLNSADAVTIGFAQALALAPGISRSGATIAAGLGRGLTREGAARYSFMLSTPAVLGAGLLQIPDALAAGGRESWLAVAAGALAAAVAGYLCIRFLLAYLRRGKLYVFAAYCAVIGAAVIVASLL